MLEVILLLVGAILVLTVGWWWLRSWWAGVDAEIAEEKALLDKWDEELPILKHILDAPDAEFEGMGLAEAMNVTREKLKAG